MITSHFNYASIIGTQEFYRMQHPDELFGYMRLDSKRTGLAHEIYVDDCCAYKMDGHPLLVFVTSKDPSYFPILETDFIPITVSKEPQVLDPEFGNKLSEVNIEEIKRFIVLNYDLLLALTNEEITHLQFITSIKNKIIHRR